MSTRHGFFRVAAACPRVSVADPERNADEILRLIALAHGSRVQAIVFPELCLTGYTSADLFFSLTTLVGGAERALARLAAETAELSMLIAVGLPVEVDARLFNCAAILQAGKLVGVVPKSHLPGYKEFYEERWFTDARDATTDSVALAGQTAPFGADLVFEVEGARHVVLGFEICEDLWAPHSPSTRHALNGATILGNLSASNELVGKIDYRRALISTHSGRTLSAYVYANTGVHESTTDVVYSGHLLIAENGVVLAEGERFEREGKFVATDVDVERLVIERMRQTSFADAGLPSDVARRVAVGAIPYPPDAETRLIRKIDPFPFVPSDPKTLDERCQEIVSIQTAGLARRLEHTGLRHLVLGLSGGLDSTLALLVCVRALELLGRPASDVLAVTMPGFGTTSRTLENARRLAAALHVPLREIDIRAACARHIQDIALDPNDTTSATFQNVQARERTQVLMDLANKEGGIVVGTGDLSELALGFCTFAGDHIAMYGVNAGVPKTLVRHLVGWFVTHGRDAAVREPLSAVLATPISPELVPVTDAGGGQHTEEIVGPYELHDFFLHALVRLGAGPAKTLFLAEQAFVGRYARATLVRWLRVFVTRFFEQQFKRSVMPDGPKVGSVSLSPRGDWRMPSDASKAAWLRELEAAAGRGAEA